MNNTIRLKRLKQLKYMLDNHSKLFKDTHFYMGAWIKRAAPFKTKQLCRYDACGSAACALGSAALYPPFMKAGLKFVRDPMSMYVAWPAYKRFRETEAGMEFFGIDLNEAEYLFIPCEYHQDDTSDIKPKHVAKRVAVLIKKYAAQ